MSTVLRLTSAILLGAALAASAAFALADPPKAGFAPDPPGHATDKHWVFAITSRDGRMTLDKVDAVTLKARASSARMMGRYALELYIGKELLDRVRFDVPLTGDGPPERSTVRPFRRPTFEHVTTRMRVQIADHPRATFVQIVDRATGKSERFWWPPEPGGKLLPIVPTAASGDAGADASAATRPPPTTTDAPTDAAPPVDAAPDGG